MPTYFETLAELCEKLGTTKKRSLMIKLVADFLKRLEPLEVEPAVSMILGRSFPRGSSLKLDVSWATISEIIKRLTNADWNLFLSIFKRTGDLGSAVKEFLEKSRTYRQKVLLENPLTIMEVRRRFEAIAEASGQGSRDKKERLLEALLSIASPLEAKYIVKILIGEMRTGFHEGLMERAVSEAFQMPLADVQRACMALGDIAIVASKARLDGIASLSGVGVQVFRPIKPMLAQVVDNVAEAIREHGGKTALEYKLDGARVQIHKRGDEVKIFSRQLTEVTESLPDIVEYVRGNIHVGEAIFEGEVIAVDYRGRPMPFQHLMRRFKRIHDVNVMVNEIPVKLFLFDLLYLDGRDLCSTPYVQRRSLLAKLVDVENLTPQIITGSAQEAESFLMSAINSGHEGLVAKRLDSPYMPGVRGKHWLKIKLTLEPLDLVIVAAEYGYGKRHKWLSDYYLAARDEETGDFLVVGKTFKGLTDAEIEEMTRKLKELTIKEEHRRVIVIPKMVVQVAYNEIQKSPKYKSGLALRFARITSIREDKTVEEVDTIQKIKEIYEKQFLKKGIYDIR
ncbi:MAG: ATP-dependent DNA ligase [Candidatus Bathyarchaeia archaeon]